MQKRIYNDYNVAPKTMQQAAYEAIQNAIVKREFEPGQCVSEREMSEKLGIGRTPVRNAMKQLAYEGWFNSSPGIGMIVADFNYENMKENFLVRAQLDALAASTCAKNVTPEMLLQLEYCLNACELALKRKDLILNTKLEADFHIKCVELSGNAYLASIYQLVVGHVPKSYYLQTQNEPFSWIALADHRGIVEAIRNGDSKLAEQRVHEHMDRIINGVDENQQKKIESKKS